MKVLLKNGYLFNASEESTPSHIITEEADINRMPSAAFERMEFCSDNLLQVYGRYENVHPSFTIDGTYYQWVDDVLTSDYAEEIHEADQAYISIEERVNDLEMAVCELYDSIVEA